MSFDSSRLEKLEAAKRKFEELKKKSKYKRKDSHTHSDGSYQKTEQIEKELEKKKIEMMLESVFSDDDEELLDEQTFKPVKEEVIDKSFAGEDLNSVPAENAEFAPMIEKNSKEPLDEKEWGVEKVIKEGSSAGLPSSEIPIDQAIDDSNEQSKGQQASDGPSSPLDPVPATMSNTIVENYSNQKGLSSLETTNQGYDPFSNSISDTDEQFEIGRIIGDNPIIDVSKPNELLIHLDQNKTETTQAPGLIKNLSSSENIRGTDQLDAEAIESDKQFGRPKDQNEAKSTVLEIKGDITTHSFPNNTSKTETNTGHQESYSISNELSTERVTEEAYDPFQTKSNETYDPFSSESQNGPESFSLASKDEQKELDTSAMEEKTPSNTKSYENYDPFKSEYSVKPDQSMLEGSDAPLSSSAFEQQPPTSVLGNEPIYSETRDEREYPHSTSDEEKTFNPETGETEYDFYKYDQPTSHYISNPAADLTLNTEQMIQDNSAFDAQVRAHIHRDGSSVDDTSSIDHDLHKDNNSEPRVSSNPHFESKDQTAVKSFLSYAKVEETTDNDDGSLVGQVENTGNHENPSSAIVSREPRLEIESTDNLRLKVQRLEADLQSAEELHQSLQVENNRLRHENASLLVELQELRLIKLEDPATMRSSASGENLRTPNDPATELNSNVTADYVDEYTRNAEAKNTDEQFLNEKEAVELSIKVEDDPLDIIPKNSLDSTRSQLKSSSSFQRFNTYNVSSDYVDSLDVKERLEQWRNWNVDMRAWKSAGIGPVFEM
ncbi:BA75_01145T0 [Komagataella pastoris]|uniref:BA75_01145T0 n=1 Tax=Komagataella pastoris TaxID=4922 RepID=A0A1B2J8P4_PICPA|nr:BA75_01145T0 [Komagataella pastoris]